MVLSLDRSRVSLFFFLSEKFNGGKEERSLTVLMRKGDNFVFFSFPLF